MPPQESGVADYSALLVPALRQRVDLQVVHRWSRGSLRRADVILYHIGNSAAAHGWILERLRRRPGLVVLHDFALHHLIAEMTLGKRDPDGYVRALEREAGVVGRLLGLGVVDGSAPPLWETSPDRFPLVGEVLALAQGLIVHSGYVERRVREYGYDGPLWRIPHPAWPDPRAQRLEEVVRGRHPVVGCFGHLNPSKRGVQLLAAFSALCADYPDALLVLAGSVAPEMELDQRLAELGLEDGRHVVREGRVTEDRLWRLMASCDVCVALRWPTRGETSGMAVRALSIGKPVIVSAAGWFAELPASVAAKVPVDDRETETIAAFLGRFAADEELRTRMSRAAAAYAQRVHGLDRVADSYAAAVEEAAAGGAVRDAMLSEVSRAAHAIGLDAGDDAISLIAARARELGIGA